MANESPLSYQQTSYPNEPDMSWEAYQDYVHPGTRRSRLSTALSAWFNGKSNYSTWQQNLMNSYNAQIGAYNAWASSPYGNRQQLEAAGYNVNYSPGTVSQGSPLSYQTPDPGIGSSELGQGVSSALSLANMVLGFKSKMMNLALDQAYKKALINNLEEKTRGTATENLWKDPYWRAKVLGLDIANKWSPLMSENKINSLRIANSFAPTYYRRRNDALAYQNDAVELQNAQELYSRGLRGIYTSGNGAAYDLAGVGQGLGYRRQFQDIELQKATVALRKQETEVAKFNAKEKEFYVSSIQNVYKQFLETQLGLAKGQLSFQFVEQDIRRKAFKWNVGLGVANTTINAIKTGFGLFNPLGRSLNAFGPQSIAPDIADYGAYGSY